jgi:hypothetical protein
MGSATSPLGALVTSRFGPIIARHQLGASIVIYATLAAVAYVWLVGPVGIVGVVHGSIAAIGLVLGAIIAVPIIRAILRGNVGESESARLGLAGAGTE